LTQMDSDAGILTQIDTDAYVPLAQTSITSAYANGAQATYVRRWGTDVFLFIICVPSVLIPVHLWLFFSLAPS